MPYMWCKKWALMTTHAPQPSRCAAMDTSRHELGVARRRQLAGFLICLSGNVFSSRAVVLLSLVSSRLGIVCSLTHFDAGLFCEPDNFHGRTREPITAEWRTVPCSGRRLTKYGESATLLYLVQACLLIEMLQCISDPGMNINELAMCRWSGGRSFF